MGRPKLLDLFCGEGGAAAGYIAAGWDVVGIDRNPRVGKRYPGLFMAGDALGELRRLINSGRVATYDTGAKYRGPVFTLDDIAAIHASPPCQGYTIATAGNPAARAKHQRLIAATRELLRLTGKPWVIENVEQARSQMVDPILLCGRMFDLSADDADGKRLVLDRHRLFESNIQIASPHHPKHGDEQVAGVYGGSRRANRLWDEPLATVAPRDRYAARHERHGGYVPRSIKVQQRLLGIDWMTVKGMQESIPPVYAEHIGQQLLAHVESERAA